MNRSKKVVKTQNFSDNSKVKFFSQIKKGRLSNCEDLTRPNNFREESDFKTKKDFTTLQCISDKLLKADAVV